MLKWKAFVINNVNVDDVVAVNMKHKKKKDEMKELPLQWFHTSVTLLWLYSMFTLVLTLFEWNEASFMHTVPFLHVWKRRNAS